MRWRMPQARSTEHFANIYYGSKDGWEERMCKNRITGHNEVVYLHVPARTGVVVFTRPSPVERHNCAIQHDQLKESVNQVLGGRLLRPLRAHEQRGEDLRLQHAQNPGYALGMTQWKLNKGLKVSCVHAFYQKVRKSVDIRIDVEFANMNPVNRWVRGPKR